MSGDNGWRLCTRVLSVPSWALRLKEDIAGFSECCLCETVSSTSYDVSGLFWADSFDNSIAVRVSKPSQSRVHRGWTLGTARRFIQLNLSDCMCARVKRGTIRDDWQAFVFFGVAYFFILNWDIAAHEMDNSCAISWWIEMKNLDS